MPDYRFKFGRFAPEAACNVRPNGNGVRLNDFADVTNVQGE